MHPLTYTCPTAATHHRVFHLFYCFALFSNTHCPEKLLREVLLLLFITKLLRNQPMFIPEVMFLNLQFPKIRRMFNFQEKRPKKSFYQTCMAFYFLNLKQFSPKSKI